MLYVIVHETGHVMKANSLNIPVLDVKYSPFRLRWIPFRSYSGFVPVNVGYQDISSIQKMLTITIAGVQSSYLLSQSMADQAFFGNHTQLHPFLATLYWMAKLDQFIYLRLTVRYLRSLEPNSPLDHNDMTEMTRAMNLLYGNNLGFFHKVVKQSWLDLFDPILFSHLYTLVKRPHEPTRMPMLLVDQFPRLGTFRILPITSLILTPYSVLEKRLILYLRTAHTPIKLTFSFGKETKVNDPVKIEYYSAHIQAESLKTLPSVLKEQLFLEKDQYPAKNRYTLYLGFDCAQLYKKDRWKLGLNLAAWRQPKLLTVHPRYAPMQLGGMGIVEITYRFNAQVSGFLEGGIKTKGFVLGYPLKATGALRAGVSLDSDFFSDKKIQHFLENPYKLVNPSSNP